MAEVTLKIEKLGPLQDSSLKLRGSVVLLFGEPSSGKSYTLKALYSSLAVLDPDSPSLCRGLMGRRAPALVERVEPGGLEAVARLVAAAALVAANPQGNPARIAEEAGLAVSRYTVKERRREAGEGRGVRVEFILSRASQAPLARYRHGRALETIVSELRRCMTRLLLPEGSLYRLDHGIEAVDPRSLGSDRIAFYVARVSGHGEWVFNVNGCSVEVGRVEAEVAFSEGSVLLRSLEADVTVYGECPSKALGVLVGRVKSEVERIKPLLWLALERRLVRTAAARARSAFSEALGFTDVVYIPFLRSSALLLRSVALRYPDPRAVGLLLEDFLREPETAALGIVYHRIGRGLWNLNKLDPATEAAVKLLLGIGGVRVALEGSLRIASRGARVNAGHASGLALETSSMALALAGSRGRPLILLEEPESQLHPWYHVVIAVALAAIAGMLGATVVVSTHSDLLTAALASLALSRSPGRAAREVLAPAGLDEELLERAVEGVEAAARRGLTFYLFEEGRVEEVEPEKIVREAPSHGKALDLIYKAFIAGEA